MQSWESETCTLTPHSFGRSEAQNNRYYLYLSWMALGGWDPASRDHRAKVKRAEAAARDLGNRLGRYPTAEEIAAESGISLRQWSNPDLACTAQAIGLDRDESSTSMTGTRSR